MPKRNHEVALTEEERSRLKQIVSSGKSSAKEIRRCNILLATDDARTPKMTVREVAKTHHVSATTINEVRKSYAEQGIEGTIKRKKRKSPPIQPKITGDVEAKIIALSCTNPPEGHCRWTIRLLADKAVELEYIDSLSRSSVNTILKKASLSRI